MLTHLKILRFKPAKVIESFIKKDCFIIIPLLNV